MDSTGLHIGLTLPYDTPEGTLVFENARILTMENARPIENGVLEVNRNLIAFVGTKADTRPINRAMQPQMPTPPNAKPSTAPAKPSCPVSSMYTHIPATSVPASTRKSNGNITPTWPTGSPPCTTPRSTPKWPLATPKCSNRAENGRAAPVFHRHHHLRGGRRLQSAHQQPRRRPRGPAPHQSLGGHQRKKLQPAPPRTAPTGHRRERAELGLLVVPEGGSFSTTT